MFKDRTKAKSYTHFIYFPKDTIRNEFSLQEKEVKKEMQKVYSIILEFINALDKKYDPLVDSKY